MEPAGGLRPERSGPPTTMWREPFVVRFSDAGPDGLISPAAICRYLQEAADRHARPYGFGLLDVLATGRAWLLVRLALRLNSPPAMGDAIQVETWVSRRTGTLRAYRDFRLTGAGGRQYGEASSAWVLLDTATRRLVRLPDCARMLVHPGSSYGQPVDASRLPSPENPQWEERFRVGWRDLDINNHANNVCFVEWALETIPSNIRRVSRLCRLDIQFLGQAFLGVEVVCSTEVRQADRGYTCLHSVRSPEGYWLARIETGWVTSAQFCAGA